MAEYCVATISDLMPHRRLRPPAADPPRPWNTTQPSPTSATHIGKRLAGKLHEPFERAGGGRAIAPPLPTLQQRSRRTMPGDRQRRRWSEGRRPRRTRTDAARAGHRAGQACPRRRSACGRPRGQPSIIRGGSRMQESCPYGSGAARLAAILAGASPANKRSPVHVVVILGHLLRTEGEHLHRRELETPPLHLG